MRGDSRTGGGGGQTDSRESEGGAREGRSDERGGRGGGKSKHLRTLMGLGSIPCCRNQTETVAVGRSASGVNHVTLFGISGFTPICFPDGFSHRMLVSASHAALLFCTSSTPLAQLFLVVRRRKVFFNEVNKVLILVGRRDVEPAS